jgi:Ca2+-binding RTX toxin-like protein
LTEAGPGYVDYVLAETPADVRAIARSEDHSIPVPLKGLDTLRFGAGIAPADIQVSRQGDSLVFAHVNGTDAVSFERWFSASAPVSPGAVLDRVEFADGTVWRVRADGSIEVVATVTTLDGTAGDDALYAPGGGPSVINGFGGNDLLVGAEDDDVIDGGAGSDTVYGNAGRDTLLGGDGDDTMYGWDGDDTLLGGDGNDRLYGDAGNDVVDGGSGDDTLFGWTGDDQLRSGEGNDVIGGDDGDDLIDGGAGSDALFGWTGADVVQGGAGWDYMDGGADNDALTGGTEGDTLIGNGGNDLLAGGTGNDGLRLGAGADIIAFNRGDGADTVYAPAAGEGAGERNDTLSLGGIRYSQLRLAREGADLLLKVEGTTDAVRLERWYLAADNQTVSTLQMIVDSTADHDAASADPLVNRRVVRLDFRALVNAFDAAYAANPSVGDWAIPAATLGSAFVAGSDTDAIGGQLAYRYGRDGNLAGLDFATASAVLADANFGTAAQSIGSGPTSGGVRLMRASATAPEAGEFDARVSTGMPRLARTMPPADDASAASALPSVQGAEAGAERVRLPRLLGRWVGAVADADAGRWLKRPFGAKLVAADAQPALPAVAICELAQPEADARVAGAPHSATGGTLDVSMRSLPGADDRTVPPRASKVRPLTAAMVDAAISGAVRSGATDRWPSINAGPVERAAIADEEQPDGLSLADFPLALARFAFTGASVSARWQRVEAYLQADQQAGIAPMLGGEDFADASSLQQIGLGRAALAIDESQRSMRPLRRTMVA